MKRYKLGLKYVVVKCFLIKLSIDGYWHTSVLIILMRQGFEYANRGFGNAGCGYISKRVAIENRLKIVDGKIRFGDFEIDTIIK